MPLIGWNRTFELGVYVFDAEHMQLLALVNDLYEAIITGVNDEAIYAVIAGLHAFLVRHSAHEEAFFHISGYPGAEAHLAEHRKLLDELEHFRKSYSDARELAFDLNAFLLRWFSDHILGLDREFCLHLRRIGIR
jgi:hemerythrin